MVRSITGESSLAVARVSIRPGGINSAELYRGVRQEVTQPLPGERVQS